MDCDELTELVTDYVEGRLDLRDRLRFQMHLGTCVGCRVYVAQVRQTVTTLAALPPPPISEPTRAEMLHRFRQWHRAREARER